MRAAGSTLARAAALLLLVLLVAVVVRLPWAGDLGIHAATVERLRHDLLDPGDPLVAADAPSPYYTPWTLLLGCVAKATGLGVFVVLRIAALLSLAVLVTGVWSFVGTFMESAAPKGAAGWGRRAAASALVLLSLALLWGTTLFNWSGFSGLNSLALTVSYPSTFALGASFWLWTLLRRAVTWAHFLGAGLLWAVILLSHQFTGVVASLGAVAMVLGARPWPGRAAWVRLGAGCALGLLLLAVWPYYSFFALSGAGGLEEIHRSLYRDLPGRLWLVALVGGAALALRWWRDRRDPLVLCCLLGALVFAAGGLSGHWSWGRVLPAVLIPAQVAAGLEVFCAPRRAVRVALGWAVAGALVVGAWAQSGTLGYVLPRSALPDAVAAKYREPWADYHWITPWVKYGEVVLAKQWPARQIPAYGAYTVAPGYPDFFLDDEEARLAAVRTYFAPATSAQRRADVLRRYGVRWVVAYPGDGGLPLDRVAVGPRGQILYRVRS
ncbi:hypothetical protein OKJ48_36995 [Streptomyces kunmingensis]|uniref:Glycosyltransferase RgtA/B/C/D-like domain-containing protein n=1 Tax=Streptomyces kunmingensis TaxID=68225 RepID=A0ABU6CNI5_9ACTN|nr:hypothetical protein [Streptomyces kunmingensis]MEB3965781.1 hypothetical protein [Streptomyces kunmingensis]